MRAADRCTLVSVPGLRLLFRIAPFIVGAVAAGVWLRRRAAARPKRLELPAPAPAPVIMPVPPLAEPVAIAARAPSRRFERREYEPIDIVTVVDDLLSVGRT